jgi:glycosyl transferase family 87
MTVWAAIRTGDWITAARLRAYCLMLIVFAVFGLGFLLARSDGLVDYQNRPLGTDFSNVYAAGKWVLERRPEAPFSPALQHEMERKIFGAHTPFYGWHYPPVFLSLAALLALPPYLLSLALWQAATLALYLWNMVAIAGDRRVLLPALAFPAVLVNIGHGHNGFLTAALFGGGLLELDKRPVVGGILLGLLVYKPQFGLLIPLVLIASGRFRAFAAAAATVIAVCAVTWAAFGTATWIAFRDSIDFTRTVVLEQGATGFFKIQSPFAALRLWGAPVGLAYMAQALLALAVALATIKLWRSGSAYPRKAAGLLTGALLVTPYLLDYDLVVLGPAIAFLVADGIKRGFAPYEKSVLAFAFVAPLVTRAVAEHAGIPLGLIAVGLVFIFSMRDAALSPPSRR